MTSPPFQFTLRRMLVAVAYASVAFAITAWIIRARQQSIGPTTASLTFLSFLGGCAVWTLLGAALGELHGSAWKGAQRAVEIPFQLAAFVVAVICIQVLAVTIVGLLATGVIWAVMGIAKLF